MDLDGDNFVISKEAKTQYTEQPTGAEIYNLTSFLEKVGVKKLNFWSNSKPFAATLAAGFAVIALSSTLWMPSSDSDTLVVDDFEVLSVAQLA